MIPILRYSNVLSKNNNACNVDDNILKISDI